MDPLKFEPGQTISHFRMEKMLGEGGMGAVYLAEDLTLSRRVALKFMHRSLLVQQGNESAREGIEKRFIREAKSAAAINHPNLAQIYEANFDSSSWYIAMEYIDGASLYDLLTEGKKFSIEEIVAISRQVVSGLEFAWENYKIIHRDIKPHNIMLSKNKLVKIVDLGLAKPIASEDTQVEMPDLTCAGAPIGTPQYMAPEQATGQSDVNYLADIFALGATLYEVVTGTKAFTGNTAPMIYMAQIQKKYTPLKEVNAKLPQALIELIEVMLEPKPEDRFSSYQEIHDKLNQIDSGPDLNRPLTTRTKSLNRPATFTGTQLSSGKTIGIDQLTLYHQSDKLIKDRYRILKPIGKSRAGVVYHCLDTQLGVECVVKSLFPGREYPEHEMPAVIENFQRLIRLSHPNLVQIRDLQLDEETGEFFVVMELLEGRNLREYTHRLRNELDEMSVKSISSVISVISKALDATSKNFNLIHHDLIPEKIYLLKNDTQVKFLDYGITYPSENTEDQIKADELHNHPMSSPDYMSPELWQRKSVSRQSDLYSFAVIIYEILADKLPFWLKDPLVGDAGKEISDKKGDGGNSLREKQLKNLFGRVLSEPPTPLSFLKRHENYALMRALAKDPHERFSTCEDFVNKLSKGSAIPIGFKVLLVSAAAILVLTVIGYSFVMKNRSNDIDSQKISQDSESKNLGGKLEELNSKGIQTAAEGLEKEARVSDSTTTNSSDQDPLKSGKKAEDDKPPNPIQVAMKPGLDKKLEAEINAKILLQKKEASKLKEAFNKLRGSLPQETTSLELLSQTDAIIGKAAGFFAKGDYENSILRYKEAISIAETIPGQLRKIEEIRLTKLRDEANNLKNIFFEQREEFLKEEEMVKLIPPVDGLAKTAEGLLEKGNYPEAISQFKKAIDTGHEIFNKIKLKSSREAISLEQTAQELRKKLNEFKGSSAEITEKIVSVDVLLSIGRDSIKKEEFSLAIVQFKNAIEKGNAILKIAEDKFQAKIGKNFVDPKVGMSFVWVPEQNYWAGKYEVTNSEFRKFKSTHDSKKSMGFSLNKDFQPVLEVSYYDAVGYCAWMNAISLKEIQAPDGYIYRLPSRDEWEAVARGGFERLYPWGNEWPPKYGNFGNQELFPSTWKLEGYSDPFPVTCDVRKSGENEHGIFGLAGNVWEWTTEIFDNKRTVLGGDWTSVTRATMSIIVEGSLAPMDEPFDNIGFRVFLALEEN